MMALVFSVGGDTLLMFVEGDPGRPQFFLFGLASFLVAHIFYLIAFAKYPSDQLGLINRKKMVDYYFCSLSCVFQLLFASRCTGSYANSCFDLQYCNYDDVTGLFEFKWKDTFSDLFSTFFRSTFIYDFGYDYRFK